MLNIASSKKWEPVGQAATFVQSDKKLEDVKKSTYLKLRDQIHFYRRFIWKHLPIWFKFLLSVTKEKMSFPSFQARIIRC